MKDVNNMTAAELAGLAGRIEHLQREKRLEERVERELPGRASFPRPDGKREWLETLMKKCGKDACKKGCRNGEPGHGPYWYLYTPNPDSPAGVKSHHLGRELPSNVAADYGLPAKLDAAEAHRYTREVREAEILQAEADAMAAEKDGGQEEAVPAEALAVEPEAEASAATT